MVPIGTVLQRTATDRTSIHHILTMVDALPSPVSAAACLGASSVRLEQAGGSSVVKRLAEAPFAACATVGPTHLGPRQLEG